MSKKEGEMTKVDKGSRILAYLRVRPANSTEKKSFASKEYAPFLQDKDRTPDNRHQVLVRSSGKPYQFDGVFWDDAAANDLFRTCAVPTLENVFNGYCGAIMAYGQTGTGKTHTMVGYPQKGEKGVIPRCADYIFGRIASDSQTEYKVSSSFVQIYMDKLQDLFSPNSPEVNIDPEAERVQLPGAVVHDVTSSDDFMRKFDQGFKHRVTRATKMNDTSSRGHAAMIVNIVATPKTAEGPSESKIGKLVLIDLAGYERFSATGALEGGDGIIVQEAKKINSSLLSLGSVVNALADKDKHIPFRNSKLTRLLKDCLGGTAKTCIICTVGPSDKYRIETLGTLYIGWRAMAVKVRAKTMTTSDPTQYIGILSEGLEKAKERIKTMATWWNKSHPNDFRKYCATYGDPEVDLGGELEGYDFAAGSAGAAAGGATAIADIADAADPAVSGEMEDMRAEFREEVGYAQDQYGREVGALAMQHREQENKLRAQGATPEQLAALRKQNEEEIREVKNLFGEHMKALFEDKNKQEIGVLLNAAQKEMPPVSDPKEKKRVSDLKEHLLVTCESKNAMLGRLFELVCHYEAKFKDQDASMQTIQKVMKEADAEHAKKWTEREEEWQGHLQQVDEHKARTAARRGSQDSAPRESTPPTVQRRSSGDQGLAPSVVGSVSGNMPAPPPARRNSRELAVATHFDHRGMGAADPAPGRSPTGSRRGSGDSDASRWSPGVPNARSAQFPSPTNRSPQNGQRGSPTNAGYAGGIPAAASSPGDRARGFLGKLVPRRPSGQAN
eukprot:NODE_191_length_2516_cov_624.104175_g10_i1.p1 GENE.NODE_191_length_2516_cov_624.104175_g10_i1~~NODE_191_length_2516_cov_624.104175_g10_i1.p1  ORF type:complete len:784 (+),score=255.13 NODE_191_length_2516_cov_624.104175_g10_i1:3-2354(+)